jgi:NhaP-type Na+/H+ or K+/H+ antiporter
MQQAETIVLLFAAVAAIVLISRKISVPYPVMLVLAGLGLSFIPRLPEVKLSPDVVSYFFCRP